MSWLQKDRSQRRRNRGEAPENPSEADRVLAGTVAPNNIQSQGEMGGKREKSK